MDNDLDIGNVGELCLDALCKALTSPYSVGPLLTQDENVL